MATSANAYGDHNKVERIMADIEQAPVADTLRVTLKMLGKLTTEQAINANDIRAVLSAGVSIEQIEDALAVCFAFNVTNRLADAFGFAVPADDAFEAGAKYLLKRGYA